MSTMKFTAPSLKEALQKVKDTLGENAVILKSEKLQAGMSGFGRREVVEVTASDTESVNADLQNGAEFDSALRASAENNPAKADKNTSRYDIALLSHEVQRMRDELGSIGKHFRYSNLPSMPAELTKAWEHLQSSGMDREWATDLAQEALIQLNADDLTSQKAIQDYLLSRLSASVVPAANQPLRRNRAFKIAVVGSPGAGKTSTLQKLLADPVAYSKRKIGILTLDTHRLAAVEQMKTFARVAGAPLEIVYSPEQMSDALSRLSTCEVILIDTPGCSYSDSVRMNQLHHLLDVADPDEIHLILNSCFRDEELIRSCSKFRELSASHLSFTRLDESMRLGHILNVARSASKPIAWLSSGQNFNGCLRRFKLSDVSDWTELAAKEMRIAALA